MADEQRRSNDDRPIVPSRAAGSLKGELPPVGTKATGRPRLKPPSKSEERVEPPRNKRPVKPEGRKTRPQTTGRKHVKPPASRASSGKQTSKPPRGKDLPDQEAARRRRSPAGEEGRGRYVRFRVHMEDGALSVVDSHLVDSALLLPATIHGEYVYEVTDGARLLHADTLPDLGVVRSFADPKGTPEQLRHHVYRQPTYDFDVRVPAHELTRASLPKLEIVLYRAKERAPTRAVVGATPLGVQFAHELREVTRVSGIPHSLLPDPLRGSPRRRSR